MEWESELTMIGAAVVERDVGVIGELEWFVDEEGVMKKVVIEVLIVIEVISDG